MSTAANNQGGKRRSTDWPASKPVLPTIAAKSTGPLSTVEHSQSEQYLDSSQAGKIESRKRQDQTSEKEVSVTKPHSEALDAKAKRAAALQSDPPQPPANPNPLKAGPTQRPQAVVGGRAGRARQTPAKLGLLCAYTPISWHDPKGVIKVVQRLLPRLPDVSGSLFHTYTLDRNLFSDPATAFEIARNKIRKLYARLRKGIKWEGKLYQIDAPYCVKVEFHEDEDGWPHFHVIYLTRRYIPADLLDHLWGLGRINVKRITNDDFHYLLKYVAKGVGYPEWVLSRHRIRIFQSSHGFLKPIEGPEPEIKGASKTGRKRASYTIRERLKRWARMGLLNENGRCKTIQLPRPFQQQFDELVLSIAEDGRYLGFGLIKINHLTELEIWLLKTNRT